MPRVSIIVPCYNEQTTIRLLLDSICQQTIGVHNLEVVIADGQSTDGTRDVVDAFRHEHPELEVFLVDNPKRNIPAALNRALESAHGEYIIRLDAHSAPAVDYVERCVEHLAAGKGENVGGVWEIRPRGEGVVSKAIALAASHRLGVGDASYRYTTQAGYVDTVPFGAFKKVMFNRYGYFDENLLTNEDYEFNARLRKNGGKIWLDPQIRSTYFARPSLSSLARQYWRYGFWKWRMLKKYPDTIRWRQALPPVFVASLVVLILGSILFPAGWILLTAELILYFTAILVGTLPIAVRYRDLLLALAVMAAIITMHISWGAGFLWSLVQSLWPSALKS